MTRWDDVVIEDLEGELSRLGLELQAMTGQRNKWRVVAMALDEELARQQQELIDAQQASAQLRRERDDWMTRWAILAIKVQKMARRWIPDIADRAKLLMLCRAETDHEQD